MGLLLTVSCARSRNGFLSKPRAEKVAAGQERKRILHTSVDSDGDSH